MDSYFFLFMRLLSASFLFYVKMQTNKISIKHCIKHGTESQTAQIISFSLIFTRSYLPVQNLGDRHPILQSWLVVWSMYCVTLKLHDIKTLNTPWKYIFLTLIFYLSGESPPSTFLLQFGQLITFIFVIHFAKSKLITRSVPVLK